MFKKKKWNQQKSSYEAWISNSKMAKSYANIRKKPPSKKKNVK